MSLQRINGYTDRRHASTLHGRSNHRRLFAGAQSVPVAPQNVVSHFQGPKEPVRFVLDNSGNHKEGSEFVGYNCTVQVSIEVSKLHTSQVPCKQHVQYTIRAERPL